MAFIRGLFTIAMICGFIWIAGLMQIMHVENTAMAKHSAASEMRMRAEFAVYCTHRQTADEIDNFLFSDRDCAHPDAPPRSH